MPIRGEKFSSNEIEKNDSWVNACNMIFNQRIFQYIRDNMLFENEMFKSILKEDISIPYIHKGFWSPMETVRDKLYLQALWDKNKAPWKVWTD